MEQNVTGQVAVGPRVGQKLQRTIKGTFRFVRTKPLGSLGLAICLVAIIAGMFSPLVGRYDPNYVDVDIAVQSPSASHWFGTDNQGRDLYARIVAGARISLIVSFTAIFVGTTIGYLVGILSGYLGGKTDMVIQRIVDAMLAFPSILLALTLVSTLGPGIEKVILAIGVTLFPRSARIARGVVLSTKENVYVDAARVIGASNIRIMLRHVLPNAMAPYLILASIGLGGAILTEASLSFLGLGVPAPAASWGRMLTGGATDYAIIAPWLLIFPGLAIMFTVLGFNLFGDTLRDIWDPKLRGR